MEKAVGNRGISAPLVFFLIVVYYAISILLRRKRSLHRWLGNQAKYLLSIRRFHLRLLFPGGFLSLTMVRHYALHSR